MATPDPDALLALGLGVAREAAALLLDGLAHMRVTVDTKTSVSDVVTEMDRASEALVVGRLLAARPDDAVLAEEGSSRPGTSGVRWVVDPLDGTTNYLYGHPGWTVSVAAEVAGRAVAGVVVDPTLGEAYWATLGGGAFCNGEPIAPSGGTALASALVATGFSYLAAERAHQAAVLQHVLPRVRDVRRHGSASLDLCWLARGRVDAYYEGPVARWDVAAGLLIASEAGARVGVIDGFSLPATSAVGATPRLAPDLEDLLAGAGLSVTWS